MGGGLPSNKPSPCAKEVCAQARNTLRVPSRAQSSPDLKAREVEEGVRAFVREWRQLRAIDKVRQWRQLPEIVATVSRHRQGLPPQLSLLIVTSAHSCRHNCQL